MDGPETYGITGLNATSDAVRANIADVLDNAPSNAIAALYRTHLGPPGFNDHYAGFDALLYINLTPEPIGYPALILGATNTPASLKKRGSSRNPLFGGSGPETVSILDGHGIFMTLVPSNVTSGAISGRSATGPSSFSLETLTNGTIRYLSEAPPTILAITALDDDENDIGISGVADQTYIIEGKTDLNDSEWSVIGTGITDNAGSYIGNLPVGTNAIQFFRAVLP
ncbi:MAG: hypothetical protein M9910_01325 [Kiritimatiellae bacterium]|nr:hypothetical protein [Kiritimatiellia bacterium]